MIVQIHNLDSVVLNLPASVTFGTAASRQHGRATVRVPRNSPAWDADVVDVRGGFLVTIQTGYGPPWVGVADTPTWTPGGMEFEASHISRWLEMARVGTWEMVGVTAGTVFRRAWRDAFRGRAAMALRLGDVLHAGPPLREPVAGARRSLLEVIQDLMDRTGQEYDIRDGRIHWLANAGQYHDRAPIVDDGRLFTRLQPGTLSDRPSEVIEVDGRGRWLVVQGDDPRPLWRSTAVEQV